jgi:hypothetical protein
VNNTLKRLAEEALKAGAAAGAVARDVGSTLSAAGKGYASGLGKGVVRAASRQGPKDGEKLFKWFRRTVIVGGTIAGSSVGLPHLMALYPQAFAWLQALMKLFP